MKSISVRKSASGHLCCQLDLTKGFSKEVQHFLHLVGCSLSIFLFCFQTSKIKLVHFHFLKSPLSRLLNQNTICTIIPFKLNAAAIHKHLYLCGIHEHSDGSNEFWVIQKGYAISLADSSLASLTSHQKLLRCSFLARRASKRATRKVLLGNFFLRSHCCGWYYPSTCFQRRRRVGQCPDQVLGAK